MGFGEEIHIQSIVFGERMVEISYTEPRDQTARVMMVRTIAIDLELVEEEVEDLLDSCRQIVDQGLVAVRNPEEKLRRRREAELET